MKKDLDERLGRFCRGLYGRDDCPDTLLDDDYDGYPNDESNLRGGSLPEDEHDG